MTISKGDPSECYVLLVKRFDREKAQGGYHRARMVSGLTLLRADDSHRSRDLWSTSCSPKNFVVCARHPSGKYTNYSNGCLLPR